MPATNEQHAIRVFNAFPKHLLNPLEMVCYGILLFEQAFVDDAHQARYLCRAHHLLYPYREGNEAVDLRLEDIDEVVGPLRAGQLPKRPFSEARDLYHDYDEAHYRYEPLERLERLVFGLLEKKLIGRYEYDALTAPGDRDVRLERPLAPEELENLEPLQAETVEDLQAEIAEAERWQRETRVRRVRPKDEAHLAATARALEADGLPAEAVELLLRNLRNLNAHDDTGALPCLCKRCLVPTADRVEANNVSFCRGFAVAQGRVLFFWAPGDLASDPHTVDAVARRLRSRLKPLVAS